MWLVLGFAASPALRLIFCWIEFLGGMKSKLLGKVLPCLGVAGAKRYRNGFWDAKDCSEHVFLLMRGIQLFNMMWRACYDGNGRLVVFLDSSFP